MTTNKWVLVIVIGVIMLVLSLMFGIPKYNVWQSKIAIETAQNLGKAELIRAQENRKIAIEEAEANKIVQQINSEIEVIRATGMAEAIEIENGKLTTKYIQYLWVRNIDKMDGDVIYIPTEANLPILEATR